MAELRNAQDDLLNTKAKIEFIKQQHNNEGNSNVVNVVENNDNLSSARESA